VGLERWHRETLKWLEPIRRSHYMREADLLASPTRAAESLGHGVWERLNAIGQRYDPQGVFYGHIGQGSDFNRTPGGLQFAI
jgi:hypothetical protein